MPVKVIFECGGCDAQTSGTRPMSRTFQSITGRSYGVGTYKYDTPQDVAPNGWVASDPYTGCSYCPECWAEIESESIPEPSSKDKP